MHKLERIETILEDGCKFKGWLRDGKRFGWCVKTYPNGAAYHGMYVNDVRHGKGCKVTANGTTKFVEYENGQLLTK